MEIDCKNAKITNYNNDTLEITFKFNSLCYNSFLLVIKKFKGMFCRCKISPSRKPRTTGKKSQNHRINGFIQQICVETGNDFDTVKIYCKKQAISRGYPFDEFQGEIIPWSEARLDTIQAGILIDTIEQLAAELKIILKED